MKMNKLMFLLAAIALAPGMAGAQAIVTERGISLKAALDLARAGLERCRADGYNPHTIENSVRKAYTAFTTRSPSVEMAKRPQPGLAGFMLLDKITAIEGGLPIFAGKELIGSIGISGAPGGEKDAA